MIGQLTVKLLLLLALIVGCQDGVAPLWSQAKPETNIRVNPVTKSVTLHNSKDVKVTIEEFSGSTKDGTTWKIAGLVLDDQASDVRLANVAQLELVDRITQTAIDGIMRGFAEIISETIAPLRGASITAETPLGKGGIKLGDGKAEPDEKIE